MQAPLAQRYQLVNDKFNNPAVPRLSPTPSLAGLAGFAKALKVKYADIEVGLDFDPEPGQSLLGFLPHLNHVETLSTARCRLSEISRTTKICLLGQS